jgi:hypothetical protein
MPRLLSLISTLIAFLALAHSAWSQGAPHELGYLYLSPVPGASYVSPQTRYVLVRFESVAPTQVTNLATSFISVTGSISGAHPSATRVATDGRTVIFEMETDFEPNELVTVTMLPLTGTGATESVQPYQYQFMIWGPMPGSLPLAVLPPQLSLGTQEASVSNQAPRPLISATLDPNRRTPKAVVMANGVSVPSDFPRVVITVNNNPSPGYLFLENGLNGVSPYTMMLDNNGLPIWYRRGRMYDFKIQKNGMITWCLSDDTGFPAFDQNFNYIKTFLTTNGYSTDGHELKILPDGRYFMIGYQTNLVDMSQYIIGGMPDSTVRETVVQEFSAADELIFQWRAWDNYNIADANGNTDFPHMNGIDIDDDGNLLVSARHISEVTKINSDTGDIIWRLSGAHSSFTFANDPFYGTSFQHNISALGNGHYMVFDNGNYHTPQVSRGVEYQLDLTNMTATVAWQFRDNPDKYAYWMGSAQRLPTGNTLIDFVMAAYPKAIEVDTNGVKRFELSLVPGADSYRAFRLPWNGIVAAPYLILEPQPENLTLVFNKFGDSSVAYYRIYGGASPHPTTVLGESTNTLKQISNLQNGLYYFRVTSVNTNGIESPFSNEESTNIDIISPGQNIVQNGDFSQGTNFWSSTLSYGASATWAIEGDASHFYITNSGAYLSSIQFLQGSMTLIQGKQYVLQFDAWSSQPRYIGVSAAQSVSPFTDYSGITPPFLTPNRTHYQYVFTMQQPSDFGATLLFDLGTSTADVYLAKISLFNPPVGDLNLDGRVDLLDLSVFCGSWLKQQGGSPADLNGDGQVNFTDFSILGQNWLSGGP